VVVCAKQVPEPSAPPQLVEGSWTLARDGKLVFDDADAVGVEVGLRLLEAAGDGADDEVVLVSMAPRAEVSGLRAGLAMGAHRAVLVTDDALAGSDALATAKVLAAVMRRLDPVDAVIAGTESTDGYTGVMPAQLAELLGLPSLTFARRVVVEAGAGARLLRAERQTEDGHDDVSCALPCLVTVTSGAAAPRYPSFKGIVGARTKPLEVLSLADLGLDPSSVGWVGAGQEIVAVEKAASRRSGEVVEDDGTGHERIVALLERLKVV
jgi:electron transfer flavoprotein beta subunit